MYTTVFAIYVRSFAPESRLDIVLVEIEILFLLKGERFIAP